MDRRRAAAVLAALALAAPACSFGAAAKTRAPEQPEAEPVDLRQASEPPPPSEVADTIDSVLPSVVNVRVTAVTPDPFGGTQEARGEGSGVIIDDNGTILTNNHVIAGAVDVTVAFTDDREPVEGVVVGRVPERDLAVIKIEADDVDAIELGRSSSLELGTDVIAIGFPLGLGGATVTKGIISGLNRTIEVGGGGPAVGVERLQSLLQTDAAINPGNSGGALVDLNGRLVGINTAAAQAGSAENIGFAIPIDDALPVVEEILGEPEERRAWLGVQIGDLEPDVALELGLDPEAEGALVVGTFPDTPAEDAGLEEGDVIVALDGEAISSSSDLTSALAEHDPGEDVSLRVLDADGVRTVDVELAQRPNTF
ncbi:MAG TPA: trypsin-like peptidase domain-containing protein [Actinomycetota bacterium]|nr:trypsin-like peptidase domain-containing protein [Actinomycetota bacterium]